MRVGFVVVVPALIAVLFSISQTGALPREPLEPLFQAESAATFVETLSAQFPSRVPGSDGASDAALWYRETIAALGLPTEEDVWTENLPDLGRVELRNIVAVVAGRSDETIVLVAHRDNAGTEEPWGENATGTAALIELGRGFAPQEIGPDPLPQHTLVIVSTDGGAYGGAGAARFVETSPLARDAIAVVVLDDLGRGRPRLAIAGDRAVTPARALVRTAATRVTEELGVEPELPSIPSQLVALGLPYALDAQGRFLAGGLSAITLGTESDARVDDPAALAEQRLGQLGRATEALVSSLDTSVGGAFRTPDSVFFADRAASGWALRLALVLSVVPFALGVVDLIVRGRRRGLPFAAALRAQRARVGYWAFAGLLVWLGALAGVFPTGAPLPLPPHSSLVTDRPLVGILVIAVALGAGWLTLRERLRPTAAPAPDERLAGLVVGLGLVGCVAVVIAFVQPYALVFVLPSLYAWLWLPLERRTASRVALFGLGLLGPIMALALLASELDMSLLDAAIYVVGLVTVGYLSPGTAILSLAWAAASAQIGALALGRYGPYAGGAEPPPPGPLRRAMRRSR
ncbi:MAG TPA: M28 family peptidase [Gaiellaceae bacterium]|nr:M28 family peptidase [Gaiellaceae bacterium]